jgi:hypothetical protein
MEGEEDGAHPMRFVCPITLDVMCSPYMCGGCGGNFEEAAIRAHLAASGKACPLCKKFLRPADIFLNRALREEIETWVPANALYDPLTAVFVGKSGVGKSRTINTLAGSAVAESKPTGSAVTIVPQVVFTGAIVGKLVRLVDAPGLFDPCRSNEETLLQLTALLHQQIVGFDAIFHVMRMGRITDEDKQLPTIFLDALSPTRRDRAELLKRYRILITHCDTSDDAGEDSPADAIQKYRGEINGALPEEFRDIQLIFLENNTRLKSDYNDADRIRDEIVNQHLAKCRMNRSVPFVPPLLADILEDDANMLREKMQQTMGCEALAKFKLPELLVLENFFRFVVESGKWQNPRHTDGLPTDFTQAWKALHSTGRDRIGHKLAAEFLPILQDMRKALVAAAEARPSAGIYGAIRDGRCVLQ